MIEAFSAWLAAGGARHATIRVYTRWTQRFLAAHGSALDHLAPAAFEAFVSSPTVTSRQDGKAAAAATQNDARAALRAFGRWLVASGRSPTDPAATLALLRNEPVTTRRVLTKAELRRLLRGAPQAAGAEAREALLVALLAVTGMRLGEAVTLDHGDLDLARSRVRVRRLKGGREQWLPVPTRLRPLVGRVVDGPQTPGVPLFRGRGGKPVSQHNAQLWIRHWCDRAGAAGDGVVARDLRRSFAEHVYRDSGCDLVLTSQALGHARVSTTAHYLGWLPPMTEGVIAELGEWLLAPADSDQSTAPG